MAFTSLIFIYIFFPLCLIMYSAARNTKQKNAVLILFSLIFYSWGEPAYMLLLIVSVLANWIIGILIQKQGDEILRRRMVFGTGVFINLALLFVFKYTGPIAEGIDRLIPGVLPVPMISLPIGLTFFTLQAISYLADVYLELTESQEDPFLFLLYMICFPKLMAGPIVRYTSVENELESRKSSANDICYGGTRAICGLAKKVIIADNLLVIVKGYWGDNLSRLSFTGAWFCAIVFALYVYFDFSGYSDIAIGLGRVFGFHFDENFFYPFESRTVTSFWRRWHISLSSFMRDYLMDIPIAGMDLPILNLFLTGLLAGLLHGLSWNFIFWGIYFMVWILLEQMIGLDRVEDEWPAVLSHLYSKIVVIIGFGIFYFEDEKQLGAFLKAITGIGLLTKEVPVSDILSANYMLSNIFLIALAIILSLPVISFFKRIVMKSKNEAAYKFGRYFAVFGSLILLVMSSILLVSGKDHSFLYFRF